MLKAGDVVEVRVQKPAAGGRMIARVDGEVVLVAGVIPGEVARVRVEKVGKGVSFATARDILEASPDRRPPATDPACGGCLYADIAYARQLTIKSEIVADSLARLGRVRWPEPVVVRPSPEHGYRMRARLHYRQQRLGWFKEGTHTLCDVRSTGQLLPESNDALDRLADGLRRLQLADDLEVELSENVSANQRVIHLEHARTIEPSRLESLGTDAALTGVTVTSPGSGGQSHAAAVSGVPRVEDVLCVGGHDVTIRRHVLSFFQGNRFLLADLMASVVVDIQPGADVVDLYAGVGIFSVAAAARGARVVAVEGDPVSSADLRVNAGDNVETVHQSVEQFVRRRRTAPDVVVVDPPRTGMSKQALAGVIALGAGQITYVSCDVATFARDTRALVEAGYVLERLEAFDLFPNTPHVETLARFSRA